MKKTLMQTDKIDETKKYINSLITDVDPENILRKAQGKIKNRDPIAYPNSNLFKATTLFEFHNGVLMTRVISKTYQTFAIHLSRQLQEEFKCQVVSEKATAELAAINYIRTLEIQRKINNYLAQDSVTELGIKFLAIMSKELDRANRHYLTAIQTLRMMKQPRMQVNIKTDTAVIGQNQIVQSNNK